MQTSRNAFQAMFDTFVAPSAAFGALRERPAWAWQALATVAIASVASVYVFMGGMSPEWIVEQQLAAAPPMPPDQLAAARSQMLAIAPHSKHISAIAVVLGLPIITALVALVYFGAERLLSKERNGYGRWFAAAAFASLPVVVSAFGLIVLSLAAADPNLPLDTSNYASLNGLLLKLQPGERGYALANAINLFQLWSVLLAAVAARLWSAIGWGRALLLAALPYLLVFLPWAAFV